MEPQALHRLLLPNNLNPTKHHLLQLHPTDFTYQEHKSHRARILIITHSSRLELSSGSSKT